MCFKKIPRYPVKILEPFVDPGDELDHYVSPKNVIQMHL